MFADRQQGRSELAPILVLLKYTRASILRPVVLIARAAVNTSCPASAKSM